jgi:hypothetical protein
VALLVILDENDTPWTCGPFSSPVICNDAPKLFLMFVKLLFYFLVLSLYS